MSLNAIDPQDMDDEKEPEQEDLAGLGVSIKEGGDEGIEEDAEEKAEGGSAAEDVDEDA